MTQFGTTKHIAPSSITSSECMSQQREADKPPKHCDNNKVEPLLQMAEIWR